MKFSLIVYISINIWHLISSGGDDDIPPNILLGSAVPGIAFCNSSNGSCNHADIQSDFKKMFKIALQQIPDVAQSILELIKLPLHQCQTEMLDFFTDLSINDPAVFKNATDIFDENVKQENLAKCSVEQFYNSPINIICGRCNDKEVEKDLKNYLDCISEKIPKIAKEFKELFEQVKDCDCAARVAEFNVNVLLTDDNAYVLGQECYNQLVRVDRLQKSYVEQRFNLSIKVFCGGCKDPDVAEEAKKAIECANAKLPESVKILLEIKENDPDKCIEQVTSYLTDVAVNDTAAFQLGLNCDSDNIDQSKLQYC